MKKSDFLLTPLKLGGRDAVDDQKIALPDDNLTEFMDIFLRRIALLERTLGTRHFEGSQHVQHHFNVGVKRFLRVAILRKLQKSIRCSTTGSGLVDGGHTSGFMLRMWISLYTNFHRSHRGSVEVHLNANFGRVCRKRKHLLRRRHPCTQCSLPFLTCVPGWISMNSWTNKAW